MKITMRKTHIFKDVAIVEFETDDMATLKVYPAGPYIQNGMCTLRPCYPSARKFLKFANTTDHSLQMKNPAITTVQ